MEIAGEPMIGPSAEAIRLCLNLLEAPTLRYTHATLIDFHGAAGEELIKTGFAILCDHEHAVDAEEDDIGPSGSS